MDLKKLLPTAALAMLTLPSALTAFSPVVAAPPSQGDALLGKAFKERISNLQVEGSGEVVQLLADDHDGSRHQRLLVRLRSGQTLLIAHNIDLAPRVPSVKVRDGLSFYGEYEWNPKGGVIHWTHRDPTGRHVSG